MSMHMPRARFLTSTGKPSMLIMAMLIQGAIATLITATLITATPRSVISVVP